MHRLKLGAMLARILRILMPSPDAATDGVAAEERGLLALSADDADEVAIEVADQPAGRGRDELQQ